MITEWMKSTGNAIAQVLPLFPESELVAAIKRDHNDLKDLIEVLKGEDVPLATKRGAYKRFSSLLKSHAHAEEKAVYDLCLKFQPLKKETFEGVIEHEVADSLLLRIQNTRKPERWAAAVKVLAELVEHHIQEEEKEFLPELDRVVPLNLKLQAEALFLELRRSTQSPGQQTGVVAELTH